MLKIGLLTESSMDIAFYEAFILNLLSRCFNITEEVNFITVRVDTSILKNIDQNSVYFFSKPIVDFAFYLTDFDDGENKRQISEWFTGTVSNGKDYPIVFGYPDPHLEHWFCHEQDAIKKVFGLDATDALVCHPNPKTYIHSLITKQNDCTKIDADFYREIGQYFNPDKLNRKPEYKILKQELRNILIKKGVAHTQS